MSLTIVSGANYEYRDFYWRLKADCYKFGYDFIGYDYGGLNNGIPFEIKVHNPKDFSKYVGKIPDKPLMLLDALDKAKESLVYMDADVRILKPFDEVGIGDYDIGLTVHDPKFHDGYNGDIVIDERYPFITCYLNSGVIFLKDTKATRKFLKLWYAEMENTTANSDQEALTNLMRKHIGEDNWDKEWHFIDEIKIKFFPASKYNHMTLYGYEEKEPKIRHFVGTVEEKLSQGAIKECVDF